MQSTKDQTTHKAHNKNDKIDKAKEGSNDESNPFQNPICKQTYDSLPKIYGRKKSNNKVKTQPAKTNKNQPQPENNRRFSMTEIGNKKNSKKQQPYKTKTKSTQSFKDKKQKQQFNQTVSKANKSTLLATLSRQIKLPEIDRSSPDDHQSLHKVSFRSETTQINFGKTGLEVIKQEKQKYSQEKTKTHNKNNSISQRKPNRSKQQSKGQQIYRLNRINYNLLKTKHKFKPKINQSHGRFDIQQQQEPEERPNIKTEYLHNNKSFQFFQLTSSSVALNDETYFRNRNVGKLNKIKGQLLQQQNGDFVVPEQREYLEYLKNYQNINLNFSVKELFKKPTFRILKSNHEVYFGEVDDQQNRHGEGINVSKKQIFEGHFHQNLKKQGCERNIQGIFVGQFKNGIRNGHGIFKWYNGEYFEGNWQNGVKNGIGIWKSKKGDYYEGQWVSNRQEGHGIFRHRTSTYKGQFKNFLKHGSGQQIFANGDRYKGQYKEGKPNGRGKYSWSNGSYYEGEFVQGMRQGRGKWVVTKNQYYQGSFKKDFKHGFGKQVYPTGQIFQGQFSQGKRTVGKLFDRLKNFQQIKET